MPTIRGWVEEELLMCHRCTQNIDPLVYDPQFEGLCKTCYLSAQETQEDEIDLEQEEYLLVLYTQEWYNEDRLCICCRQPKENFQSCCSCFPEYEDPTSSTFCDACATLKIKSLLVEKKLSSMEKMKVNNVFYTELMCNSCFHEYSRSHVLEDDPLENEDDEEEMPLYDYRRKDMVTRKSPQSLASEDDEAQEDPYLNTDDSFDISSDEEIELFAQQPEKSPDLEEPVGVGVPENLSLQEENWVVLE